MIFSGDNFCKQKSDKNNFGPKLYIAGGKIRGCKNILYSHFKSITHFFEGGIEKFRKLGLGNK